MMLLVWYVSLQHSSKPLVPNPCKDRLLLLLKIFASLKVQGSIKDRIFLTSLPSEDSKCSTTVFCLELRTRQVYWTLFNNEGRKVKYSLSPCKGVMQPWMQKWSWLHELYNLQRILWRLIGFHRKNHSPCMTAWDSQSYCVYPYLHQMKCSIFRIPEKTYSQKSRWEIRFCYCQNKLTENRLDSCCKKDIFLNFERSALFLSF